MLDHGCDLEATPKWGRREFLDDIRASELKGNTGAVKKILLYFVDDICSCAGHKHLIVNTELTAIKITLAINLKWHNLDYPCYPVGRPHVTFPVTTKNNIP
jgi:hypothetical protein